MRKIVNVVTGEVVVDEDFVAPSFPTMEEKTPQTVSMAQARLALRRANLFDTIQGGLESLPEPQRTEALEAWEYAPYVSREGMLVTTLSKQFGLSDEVLDLLFTQAALIKL